MQRTGAQIVWETIVKEGSTSYLAIPAARSCLPMTPCRPTRVRHILVRHEQNTAHMAEGWDAGYR